MMQAVDLSLLRMTIVASSLAGYERPGKLAWMARKYSGKHPLSRCRSRVVSTGCAVRKAGCTASGSGATS